MKLSLILANLRRQQKIFVIILQYVFTLSKQMSRTVAKKIIKCWGKTTSVVKDLSSVEDSSVDQLCVLHFHNCFSSWSAKIFTSFFAVFMDVELEHPLIRTIFRFSWEFESVGFCFLISLSYGCIFIKVRCSHSAAVQGERKLTSTLHVSCYLRIFINLVSFGSVL